MQSLRNLSLKQVRALAVQLAQKAKNRDLVIGLIGELGSGKTTFVKSFAKILGIRNIKSPTFIVVRASKAKKRWFYHIDLYRLKDKHQIEPLDLEEILNNKKRWVLIEWVDKFPQIRKHCDIIISLRVVAKNKRDVQIIYQ